MAYRKRNNRRRKYRKRRPRREPTAIDVAQYALSGVKKIYRMINVEYKFLDTTIGSNINEVSFINSLAAIPQGDNQSSRDGISIKPINLSYRINFLRNSSDTTQMVRMIIFRGKQENTVNPVTSDVLQDTTGTASVQSFKNYDKKFKTKILYDKVFVLDEGNSSRKYISNVIRLDGHINYDISDTTGSTVESGGIYVLLVGNSSNAPASLQKYRLTYTDN